MGISRTCPGWAAQVKGVSVVSTRMWNCRQKTSLQQNLKAVADSQDQAAGTREPIHCFHHRRETRNSAGAQIIAKGKPARKNDGVQAGNIFGLVPDKFNRLANDGANGMISVVVAIRTRELDYAELHRTILAQSHLGCAAREPHSLPYRESSVAIGITSWRQALTPVIGRTSWI